MLSITDHHFLIMATMVAKATGLPGPAVMPTTVDWRGFQALCNRHHVAPLVFQAAPQWPGLPGEVLDGMRQVARNAGRAGLGRIAAQAEIARALQQAGIRFLVLKGVPLSVLLFNDPVRRSSGDIDLLVAPADFATARRVLRDLGYQLAPGMPPLGEDTAPQACPRDLIMHRGTVWVELHQRLTDNPDRFPFDFDTLHAGRQLVTVAGLAIPTLGPAHQGIYLFVHGAGHGWERLAWLTDIALLCRDREVAAGLGAQIRSLGMERAGGQAFALIRLLLGAAPPPGIQVPTHPGWLTRWLATGHAGPRRGPVWALRTLCMHWVGWRLRGGLAAFRQEVALDLFPDQPTGPLDRLRPVSRLAGFLWRRLR